MPAFAIRLRSFSPFQNFNEFFISIVYFVQGSAGIVGIAAPLILREELGLDFFQMGLIGAAAIIPWSIKPLYGLLTDLVPIAGLRRKPYLHIGPLIAVLGYAYIAFFATDFASFLLPLVVANLGLGLTDVATDGMVVESSTSENAARLQGITQASIRVAAFITSFFSGLLIYRQLLTPHEMYLLAAALPLLVFTASFFLREKRVSIEAERIAQQVLSVPFILSMLVIFVAIVTNLVQPELFQSFLPLSPTVITAGLWLLFFGWMAAYFNKLRKQNLATGAIFIAAAFILLWRFNPGAGSPFFFFVKDTLGVPLETLGFIDTAAQVGSLIAVVIAVKIFDRFPLKRLLFWTVLIAGLFGLTSFAITRPEVAQAVGSFFLVDWLATLIALPVYFFEMFFSALLGSGFTAFWQSAVQLSPLENFLYLQSFLGEVLFMLAYIPLLKFAVLITPKKAEATNFAVITSIMNIGLALSAYTSGWLYENLRDTTLPEGALDVSTIELLIWVSIITSFTCLIVLPFIKTKEAVLR